MLSMLQRRALYRMIVPISAIFIVGLALIAWHLHSLLTPDVRAQILDIPQFRATLLLAAAWTLGLVIILMIETMYFIRHQVTGPVAEMARLSEAVGRGQLSVPYQPYESNDEVGRLSRATVAMVAELNKLAASMKERAEETAGRARSIADSARSVATSTRQNAAVADELSATASTRQQALIDLASSAGRMTETFSSLRESREEGLRRERRLRDVAEENRARLDDNSRALDSLTTDSLASAEAISDLALAVEEIRAFLSLVQKISRQSKLLSLNAAMEAARAGEQGEGFAVVAGEVRRLAASSAEAAQRTDALVKTMVENVERARDCTTRTVTTARGVMETTLVGRRTLSNVEYSAKEAEEWTVRVETTLAQAAELVASMSERLNQIAKETVPFSRTMKSVATASDEESRAITEIASGAIDLTTSAARLSELASTFRTAGS